MRYICAVFEGLIVTIAFYGIIYYLSKKGKLNIPCDGFWMQKRSVWIWGLVTFCCTCGISAFRWIEMPIALHVLSLFLVGGMAVLAETDFLQHWVPNRMLAGMLMLWALVVGVTIISDTQYGMELLGRGLIGGIASGLIFLLCYILSKRQLGAGDVKLAFIMGLYMTGQRIMGGIVYGTLLCFLYSIIQLVRKKLTVKDQVPLVPFLYGGVLITYFIL
ncbi:MAG: prepilin peptidase [Lachnospiraceae bacterium]|nr:prepilin peptidase [Lachnospiraceae bacterium]